MEDKVKKVLGKLQFQCSKREYCESDVFSKALKSLEGDREAAQAVTDALVKEKYVDNLRYASAFAREKSSITGWGRVKIGYMLAAKGISRQTIAEALEETDEKASDRRMENLLRAKFRTMAGSKDAKLKLLKFALGRGYEYDEVQSLVNTIIKEYDASDCHDIDGL